MSVYKQSNRLTSQQLRDLYRGEYVGAYHQEDTGRLRHILERVPVTSKDAVADLACGNGLLLEAFSVVPQQYVGVDFSAEFIDQARRRFAKRKGNFQFICQDIAKFSRRNKKKFDWIFTLDFSEHIYDDQFVEIYGAIAHSLKPNGQLVLHTPNADFLLERLKSHNWLLKQFPEHVAVRRAEDYLQLLERAGYKKIRVEYLPHYHPLLSWLRFLHNWPVLKAFLRARLLIFAQAQE
jgi:SAM-dependent methyltransferase